MPFLQWIPKWISDAYTLLTFKSGYDPVEIYAWAEIIPRCYSMKISIAAEIIVEDSRKITVALEKFTCIDVNITQKFIRSFWIFSRNTQYTAEQYSETIWILFRNIHFFFFHINIFFVACNDWRSAFTFNQHNVLVVHLHSLQLT